MKLTHWTDKPITTIHPYTIPPEENFNYKPTGFWFDVDEDWKRWCEANDFRLDRLLYRHEVIIDWDRILLLKGAIHLDVFTRQYKAPPLIGKSGEKIFDGRRNCRIDWDKVGKEYAGVVIAPYCWQRRMDLLWYYGWDCASGCVWDISAIVTLGEPIAVEKEVTEK